MRQVSIDIIFEQYYLKPRVKKNIEIENLYIIYKSLSKSSRAIIDKVTRSKEIKNDRNVLKEIEIRLANTEIKVFNRKKTRLIKRFAPTFDDNIFAEYVKSKYDSENILELNNFYKYCRTVSPIYDLSNIELFMLRGRLDVIFRTFNSANNGDNITRQLKTWCHQYGYTENALDIHKNKLKNNMIESKSNMDVESKITLVSYFAAGIGIGNYAKTFGRALAKQNELGYNDLYHIKNDLNHIKQDSISDINIFILGLDQFSNLDLKFNFSALKRKYNIAIPFWELETISSKDAQSLKLFDEIWAPSDFIFNSLSKNLDKSLKRKLKLLPIVFKEKKQLYGKYKKKNNQTLKYFICVADLASGIDRKNLLGTILSFQSAFSKVPEKIYLYLKIYDSSKSFDYNSIIWKRISKMIANDRNIIMIDKYLDAQQLDNLISDSLGLISLHKSEGLGLNIIDAMQLGVPVICTGYGGNMSFCNLNNSLLVEFSMSSTHGSTDSVYSLQSTWAEPSISSAVEKFNLVVYGNSQDIRDMTLRAKRDLKNIQSKNSFTINKMLARSRQRSKFKKLIDFLN